MRHYKIYLFPFIFIVIFIVSFLYVWNHDQYGKLQSDIEKYYSSCITYKETGKYVEKRFDNQKINDEIALKYHPEQECDDILKYDKVSFSTFSIYNETMESSVLGFVFALLFPLSVIFPTAFILSGWLKSRIIKNELLREKYNNILKKHLKQSHKSVYIAFLVLVCMFLISFAISKHFYIKYEVDSSFALFDEVLFSNPMFYIIFIVTILINLEIYYNITLIIQSFNTNYAIVSIETLLIIYFIWFGSELVISPLLQNLKVLSNYSWISLYSVIVFPYKGYPFELIFVYSMLIYLITLLILLFLYKKERIILLIESKGK